MLQRHMIQPLVLGKRTTVQIVSPCWIPLQLRSCKGTLWQAVLGNHRSIGPFDVFARGIGVHFVGVHSRICGVSILIS